MNIDEIILALHKRHLDALNMYRFVERDTFRDAYNGATDKQKEIACVLIANGELEPLEEWTKRLLIEIRVASGLDFRSLRILAGQCGVKNYSRLNKEDLIHEIQNQIRRIEKKSQSKSDQSQQSRPDGGDRG